MFNKTVEWKILYIPFLIEDNITEMLIYTYFKGIGFFI